MTDHEIVTAMATFGGSFYKRLAEAWFHGDDDNRARIKATWADKWEECEDIAERYAKRKAEKASA